MINELGKRIRFLRTNKNISINKLAIAINLSESAVGMIERGERETSLENIVKISNFFEVTTDYLLKGEISGQKEQGVNNPYPISDSNEADQLVIKCNGVTSKVFINGQEINGLVAIKFSHITEELAELELSTIVIPN